MRLLVIGAGMYVTGRGTPDAGTVLLSLAQVAERVALTDVVVCARGADSASDVARCRQQIRRELGKDLPARYALVADVLRSNTLKQDFDAAIVVVPDDQHHALGLAVLNRGLHCLMAKPLTPTRAEARELIAAQARHGTYAAVELHKRFDEANLVVRKLLLDGSLGRVSHITVEYSQRITVPRDVFASWSHRTNIFQYLGVHYVDLVYFLTGAQPVRALAVGTRGVLSSHGIDTHDSVHALVEWANPADHGGSFVAQYTLGWVDPSTSSAMSDQRFTLVGSRGRVDCDQKNRGVNCVLEGRGLDAINPYFSKVLATMDGPRFGGYGHQSIERFVLDVDDLRNGRVTPSELASRRPTFADALPSTAVIEAVNASLAEGSTWKDARVQS